MTNQPPPPARRCDLKNRRSVAKSQKHLKRFETWLHQQQTLGRHFTEEQTTYLHLIKQHIAASLTVAPADLQNPPFSTHGGLGKARQLFGNDLNPLLEELALALVA